MFQIQKRQGSSPFRIKLFIFYFDAEGGVKFPLNDDFIPEDEIEGCEG